MLSILSVQFLNFNKIDRHTFEGKLNEAQLSFVMESYNWKSKKILIMNFRQLESSCYYNNYKNLISSLKWWPEFYSNMELENIRNIFVYYDNSRAEKVK